MIGYKLFWHGKKFMADTEKKLGQNLDRVGVFLQGEIVQSFGSSGAPGKGGPTTPTGRKTTAKRYRSGQHSAPGDPPFVQTGMLRRSITFVREGLTKLLVGSSLKPQGSNYSYAWLLEMGSPGGQLAARPYLRPAVRKNKRTILQMIAGK